MADELTLDVADPQVLVHFPDDPHLTQHHRLLLCKLSPGRWIAATPDHDLEVLDLNAHRHTVLGRRCAFPDNLFDDVYAFDPISKNDLEGLRRRAKTMMVVLGDGAVEEIGRRVWLFSDPSSTKLGMTVPDDDLRHAMTLGNRGLVEVDGCIEAIEEVPIDKAKDFKDEKKGSLGDLRTLGHHVDNQNVRFISLTDAFPLMRETAMPDWTFEGPRAVKEFLGSVIQGTADLTSYHLQWLQHSGVNPRSSIGYEHKYLIECLRLSICRDQLDPTNLLGLELLTRRIVQLEVAVARNSAAPDFSGLDMLMESPISQSGTASTRALDTWLTSRLKEKASIQKHTRLYREEMAHKTKDKSGGAPVEDQGQGSWRRRRPKAKAKQGAGAGGTGAGDN